MSTSTRTTERDGAMVRFLDGVERVGNRIPHPFWLFLMLGGIVLVLSWVLSLLDVSVQSPAEEGTVEVVNLLSVDGLRRIVEEAITNFTGFPPLGIVLAVMLGVAVAEGSGLITAAVRGVVTRVKGRWLTFAVALTGVTGSIASDAVTVILPPLAALAYLAVGRSPLLGIAVGFASVSAGFNASLVVNATDPLLAGISTTAVQVVEEDYVVSPLANIYFTVPSSILIAAIITVVLEKWVAPRVEGIELDGPRAPGHQGTTEDETAPGDDPATDFTDLESMRLSTEERRGLRNAAVALVVFLVVLAGVVAIPGSPLRGEEGEILTGPALLSVSILIALMFIVVGIAYGRTVGSISSAADVPEFMVSGMRDLAPVLVLFFAAAQFIAWFDWSNIGTVLAVSGADLIESMGVPTVVLFIALILMTYALNLFITSGSAQWTLMAPVVVPALMLLGIDAEVSQMLFRIGDSASNIVTPLNVYFALMLTYLQRYRRDAGIGTLLAMTLPASVAILVGWTAFFLLWYAVGLPLGPGVPVR
jgi:aminobenzoyl-glutamate transport protein